MGLFEDYQKRLNTIIIRSSLSQAGNVYYSSDYISEAIEYFDSQNHASMIRNFMKKRFGIVADQFSGSSTTSADDQLLADITPGYRKANVNDMIDLGMFESYSSRIGCRIGQALSNLFSTPSSRWTFVSENPKHTGEEVDSLISSLREKGQFLSNLIAADYCSTTMGTGIVRISWANGIPSYDVISPDNIIFIYGDTVKGIDDNVRTAIQTSIEDCVAVCVRVSNHDKYDYWVAYCGRSEDYPEGRMVTYRVDHRSGDPTDIPMIGDPSAMDYQVDGKPCNPLTYIQNRFPDLMDCEYPFIVLSGGYNNVSKKLLDIHLDLFESSMEIETAFSRLLKDAEEAALGIRVLELNNISDPVPDALSGSIAVLPGQKVSYISTAAGISSARDAILALASQLAYSYNVPPEIITNTGGVQPSSGSSLAIQLAPLESHRDRRVAENMESVKRIFQIEKGLLAFHEDLVLSNVYSNWSPGKIPLIQTHTEKLEMIEKRRSLGLSDLIQDTKDLYALESEEDAIALLEKFKARSNKFGIAKAPILPERSPRNFE